MIPDALTNDIGPLPAWGWLVAAGAGIFIGRKVGGNLGGSADTPKATAGGVFAGVGSSSSPLGLAQRAPAKPKAVKRVVPETNRTWRSKALTLLIGEGYEPLAADNAIANYLAGRAPSPDDEEAIQVALRALGLPPRPPTIIPVEAPAAPTTTTTGEPDRVRGDRLSEIVREAYVDILGREPDAEGLAFWRGELASGAVSATDLRRELGTSVEFDNLLI